MIINFKKRPSLLRDVTGVILAGGKSRRFGKNKALEMAGEETLIDRVLNVMGSIFDRLILISNTPKEYSYLNIPIYEDIKRGYGPLGGIITGLSKIADDCGFFVACDMPCLNPALIRYMVDLRENHDVVVPRISPNKIEPLHALYRSSCIPFIEESIRRKRFQIQKFFPHVSVRYVEIQEIGQFDPGLTSFININTPKELHKIRTRLRRTHN